MTLTSPHDPLAALRGRETPYTNSRARVLHQYSALRRAGATPLIAMHLIHSSKVHALTRLTDESFASACLEWDEHHARRYLKIIEMRGWK